MCLVLHALYVLIVTHAYLVPRQSETLLGNGRLADALKKGGVHPFLPRTPSPFHTSWLIKLSKPPAGKLRMRLSAVLVQVSILLLGEALKYPYKCSGTRYWFEQKYNGLERYEAKRPERILIQKYTMAKSLSGQPHES